MGCAALLRSCWKHAALACVVCGSVCGLATAGEPFAYSTEQILAPGGQAGDWFGYSIALGDGYLAVGATKDNTAGEEAGAVYVYNASSGAFVYKLIPPDLTAGDRFGYDVAIKGNILLASAPDDDAGGVAFSGSVYMFALQSGVQVNKFVANNGTIVEQMGWSVAITDGAIVAGAVGGRNSNGVRTGAVYAFSTQSFSQLARFSPVDGTTDAFFGDSLALSQSYLAVGAPRMNNGIGESGAVYLYSYFNGNLIHKFIPNDARVDQSFGSDVAISGDRIFIGSGLDDEYGTNSGSVYVFDAISGNQIIKIPPYEPGVIDWFGLSIAVDGDTLLIGAPFDDEHAQSSGAVFVYDANTYQYISKIKLPDAMFEDAFGFEVAAADAKMAAGTWRRDDQGDESGAAYLISYTCFPDLNNDSLVDFFDVSTLINVRVDYNGDGVFNFFDVSEFLSDYQMGCP